MQRITFTSACLAAAMALATTPAAAQADFPIKPIHIVVPFSPGGIVDSIARVVGDKLSAKYGQTVIVDNKPGAGGAIATEAVARAPADGYTLLLVSPGHAVNPTLQKVNWNPVRDFRAIVGFGFVPNVFVVNSESPVKSMQELVDMAKKNPNPLTYATAGIGTSNHLSGELLAQDAGIKLTQVPYKGQPDAMSDLLAGRVDTMPLTMALALPQIKAGKLRPLAVTTAKRSTALPEVPTVAEAAKLPGYEVGTWFGLVTPAKTPEPVIRKLSTDVTEILAMPDVKAKLDTLGMEAELQDSAAFDVFVSREFDKWSKVIKQAGIEPR